MLNIVLPPEVEKKLAEMAKLAGQSETQIALDALREYLADIEDGYIAECRMRDNPEFVDLDTVMAELGITMDDLDESLLDEAR